MKHSASRNVRAAVLLLAMLAAVCLACSACEKQSAAQVAQGETKHEGEPSHDHAHDHEDDHIHRNPVPGQCENIGVSVTLSPETARKIGLKLAKPSLRRRISTIELTGRVSLNEDMVAHISPRAQGTIKQVDTTLGDEVEEGDVLALLDSAALREAKAAYLTAMATVELLGQNYEREKKLYKRKVLVELNSVRAEYLSAKATAELLKKNYEREKTLFEKKISPEKDLIETETEYRKALIEEESAAAKLRLTGLDKKDVEKSDWAADPDKIEVNALSKVITEAQKELYESEKEYEKAKIEFQFAEAKLHLMGLEEREIKAVKTHGDVLAELAVRAPFTGTIIKRHVAIGENVGPDSKLFVLADLDVLWVQADVYEKDMGAIKQNMGATVTCAAYPNERFEGEISYIHHLFDECASKGKIRIEVLSDGKLKAGMFVKVVIDLDESARSSALYLPERAVQNDGTCCNFVFVATGSNTYESKKVTSGETQGREIEITSGLKPDDMVVTEGGFALKSEILKSKLGTG